MVAGFGKESVRWWEDTMVGSADKSNRSFFARLPQPDQYKRSQRCSGGELSCATEQIAFQIEL